MNVNGLVISLIDDLSNTSIKFGDYIRLKGLRVGDIFRLQADDTTDPVFVLIGNATPYMSITTSDGCIGWSWDEYNHWRVMDVVHLTLKSGGRWMSLPE